MKVEVNDRVPSVSFEMAAREVAVLACGPRAPADAAYAFLGAVAAESVAEREGEWLERGIDVERLHPDGLTEHLKPALRRIFEAADEISRERQHDSVLLCDVLAAVNRLWCRIHPFCS